MKIGQVIHSLGMGGAEKLVVTFANIARERGVEIGVVTLAHAASSNLDALHSLGVPVYALPAPKLIDPLRFRQLVRLLQAEHFDVVQSHLESGNILGVCAGRLTGTPVVATLHLAGMGAPARHRAWLETLALRYGASRVVAVGPQVAQAHAARIRRPVSILSNPVPSLASHTLERAAGRRQITGTEAGALLISVGRLVPAKGQLELLDAFAQVHAHMPQTTLVIVGDGPLYAELANRIRALALTKAVVLTGTRRDVPALLAAADLYVSSSLVEGTSLAILEAMAAGLPIVATSVGDTPTLLTDHTGITVPAGDTAALAQAICTLLADPEMRWTLGENAANYVRKHHDPYLWFDQLMALFQVTRAASVSPARREVPG